MYLFLLISEKCFENYGNNGNDGNDVWAAYRVLGFRRLALFLSAKGVSSIVAEHPPNIARSITIMDDCMADGMCPCITSEAMARPKPLSL